MALENPLPRPIEVEKSDNRHVWRRAMGGESSSSSSGDDHVGLERRKLAGERRKPRIVAIGITGGKGKVRPLDKVRFRETTAQRGIPNFVQFRCRGPEHADETLLCARKPGPQRGAAGE